MISICKNMGKIELPIISGEFPMIPFDIASMKGLGRFKSIAIKMLEGISNESGTAYFTIHGKKLSAGQTLRRGGAHIDGNYEPHAMDFGGGGGWKVGQEGRPVGHPTHARQFEKETGGIVLASNYYACNGWGGEYKDIPKKGGDCTHFDLGESFKLEKDTIYYGNNHFIHESIPMRGGVHRVFARITLPEQHVFK